MVDIAIVKYEHTSRTRVRVSEGDDKFPEELDEMLQSDRARDDIMGDNAINGEDWEDGILLSPDKKLMLNAMPSHECPALLSS